MVVLDDALLIHIKSCHLFAQIGTAVLKIVFQRIRRQHLLVSLSSLLAVEIEDTSLLKEQHRTFSLPSGIDDVRLELAAIADEEIATLNQLTVACKILYHVPEVAQLTVSLALTILFLNPLDGDLQHLVESQRRDDLLEHPKRSQRNTPVVHDTVLTLFATESVADDILRIMERRRPRLFKVLALFEDFEC